MLRSRRVVASMLVAGALVVTAACSGDDDPKPAVTAPTTPAGPTLLTFAVYGPPQVITAYAKIAADFSAAHPDIVVNVRPYDGHDQAAAALQSEQATGDVPDAFLANLDDLPGLVESKAIRRVDELLAERHVDFGDGYQRDPLESFSADDALQCMPVDVSPLVVYLNTDLVHLPALTPAGQRQITPESGWSLDQFAAAARQAIRRGVRGVYVAPDLEQVAPFIWSGGGHIVDDFDQPTTLTLADGPSAAALEKLLEVVRDPQLTFSPAQLARRSALRRFKSGSLGMMLGYRSLTPQLRAQENLNFDVMPLPKVRGRATIGESNGAVPQQRLRAPREDRRLPRVRRLRRRTGAARLDRLRGADEPRRGQLRRLPPADRDAGQRLGVPGIRAQHPLAPAGADLGPGGQDHGHASSTDCSTNRSSIPSGIGSRRSTRRRSRCSPRCRPRRRRRVRRARYSQVAGCLESAQVSQLLL